MTILEGLGNHEFLNDTSGGVSGCLDYGLQRTVPLGEYYHTENCEICLCSAHHRMCKQVACAPPENCPGYLREDSKLCCKICVPLVVERPHGGSDREGLSLRLGVGTLLLFLLLSLILFAFHRLRKKRLLFTLRRIREIGRIPLNESSCSSEGPRSLNGSAITVESSATELDGPYCLVNGYAFPGAPPTYLETVIETSGEERIRNHGLVDRASSPIQPLDQADGEPPPPYFVPPLPLPLTSSSPVAVASISARRLDPGSLREFHHPPHHHLHRSDTVSLSSDSDISARSSRVNSECSSSSDADEDLDAMSCCSCSDCNSVVSNDDYSPDGEVAQSSSEPRDIPRRKRLKRFLFRKRKCKRSSRETRNESEIDPNAASTSRASNSHP